ncbi:MULTISPECIES: SDR family oxidoreductase [unclassified Pantoea]|uniref:SDR family oxidoreductase n=1 Tax=unclassified Pantoea TaxID=2630326 RepID=UPI001CD27A68|nr:MULTISPECIES: SDR family oxidoreductase [unclassified Pantoea]MCA1179589.1 SDR family oxidoreductase [Pantoea sp. alder69]MCA1251842.1 SDR family oxidoreductase [Pantoea sp. alder70]MCA1267821.1 SDR family oxidoreductase [Pantoea sp. alder81]
MSITSETVTVITGASSGIGSASAIRIAKHGGTVILAARNEEKLKSIVNQIKDSGGYADYKVTDVTDIESLKSLGQYVQEKYGRIDHLVNNAGLMLFSNWKDVALDDWKKMIDTNIHGYLNALAVFLPVLVMQKHGHILNMSSVAGIHTGDASGVYSATKFFIRGLTESLRREIGVGEGIQVSMISPGVINTGWADKVENSEGKGIAKKLNEIAISPEEVADAVAYALDKPQNLTINDIVIHPTLQGW